jgi:ribosomal protein S19
VRSVWKGFFTKNTSVLHKSSTLFNTMLKQKFLVHDGRSVKFLLVSEHMIGFKAGEFTFTRKMGVSHKKKKIKKGKKK